MHFVAKYAFLQGLRGHAVPAGRCKYVEGPAAECNPSIQRLEPALAVAVKVVGVTAAVPLNSVELACTRAREMNTVCAAAQLSPAVLGSSIARSLLGKVGELRPVMLPLAAVGAAVATALSSTRVGRSTKSNNFKTISDSIIFFFSQQTENTCIEEEKKESIYFAKSRTKAL